MSWGVAAPRTTAEPPTEVEPKDQGLSAQTLIIAAISSGIAAVVVSHFWEKGTIFASAMTPVVVALVSEGLRKPIQSERVRRPVRAVGSSASRVSRISQREEARPPSGRTPNVIAPPSPGVDEGLRQREEGVEPGPVKVYSSGSHRRPGGTPADGRGSRRIKIAVVTGLIAFLIAAVALTLPELIFGGSVTGGDRGTTYFGGGESSSDKGESQDGDPLDGQPDEPTQEGAPSDGDDEAPESGGETAPGAPEPEQTAPAPEAPTQPPPESPTQTAP